MEQYIKLLTNCINGKPQDGRNGRWRLAPPVALTFDVRSCIPLCTLRRTAWKLAINEMNGFIAGDTDAASYRGLWDNWKDGKGGVGPVYGAQWQDSQAFCQMPAVGSRRGVVVSWNEDDLEDMALPPCHFAWQVFRTSEDTFDVTVFMRSCDVPIGLPFNMIGYWHLGQVLGRELGQLCNLNFLISLPHIYEVHVAEMESMVHNATSIPPFPSDFDSYEYVYDTQLEVVK